MQHILVPCLAPHQGLAAPRRDTLVRTSLPLSTVQVHLSVRIHTPRLKSECERDVRRRVLSLHCVLTDASSQDLVQHGGSLSQGRVSQATPQAVASGVDHARSPGEHRGGHRRASPAPVALWPRLRTPRGPRHALIAQLPPRALRHHARVPPPRPFQAPKPTPKPSGVPTVCLADVLFAQSTRTLAGSAIARTSAAQCYKYARVA